MSLRIDVMICSTKLDSHLTCAKLGDQFIRNVWFVIRLGRLGYYWYVCRVLNTQIACGRVKRGVMIRMEDDVVDKPMCS